MGPEQVLPLGIRVDLAVMVMNEYSLLPKSPELELLYQMQFSIMLQD